MKRRIKQYFLVLLSLMTALPAMAQLTIDGRPPVYDRLTQTYLLTVPESAFGGPLSAAVAIDDGVTQVEIAGQSVTDSVFFPVIKADTCYSVSFTRGESATSATLYFTYLPIMCMSGTFGNEYVEAPVQMIMPESNGVSSYRARIKWAGTSTNGAWTHKHNYHVKFVDEQGEKMDVSFFGLRNDNHWRMDAGTIDMLRIRNKVAHGLWADFGAKNYYAAEQPKARTYVRGQHIEAFLNGEYVGFYDLAEYLDRKQMKLKKYSEVVDSAQQSAVEFHGMLWKAKERTSQTMFVMNTECDSTLDSWAGFELMYPDIDEVCPTDYSVLRNAVDFVAKSITIDFNNQVGDYFDLPVLVNFYVFIHTLFAIDNTCNNIIWGCYDSQVDKKLTLAVWDMDATAGQHWRDQDGYYHAPEIQPENDLDNTSNNISMLGYNRLFQRLKRHPDFLLRATNCYWRLRDGVLDPDSLIARYGAVLNRLKACGALGRETVRWSDTGDIAHRMLDFDGEYEYLCDWLRRRIDYMDTHTFARMLGDVNGDGLVTVGDVSHYINYLLGSVSTIKAVNADMDMDDSLDISDVVRVIAMLLND